LPITLAYFSGFTKDQATDASRYTSTNFTSTTFTNQLAVTNPLPLTYAANLHSDQQRRANAILGGYPANLFLTNPDLRGGVALTSNSGYTRYDSLQIELRRRLSGGLLVGANYVWAKAFESSRVSFRVPRYNNLNAGSPGYVAHAFKLNWGMSCQSAEAVVRIRWQCSRGVYRGWGLYTAAFRQATLRLRQCPAGWNDPRRAREITKCV
jgi:hypothetical protein